MCESPTMRERDLHEDLVRFYEFQLGNLPIRDEFKRALRATFTSDELGLFFLLPFSGQITMEKLETKAAKAGIAVERVRELVKRLIPQGVVASYVTPTGRVCERAPFIALVEMQVRNVEDSPMRQASLEIMDALIEGKVETLPTRTPYYRVLPVERSVARAASWRGVPVDVVVPDPREVLPTDVVSEMIREQPVIALAGCYCRVTKELLGQGCGHAIETCFYFNELALKQIESGFAREIGSEEALGILRDCEEQGLVHNVSNCEGSIQTLCNCCTCSCGMMKGRTVGKTNALSTSRYIVALDDDRCTVCEECVDACPIGAISVADGALRLAGDRCIGCGQCVASCPHSALRLVLREKAPKTFRDNAALFRRINLEAMIGLAVRKIAG